MFIFGKAESTQLALAVCRANRMATRVAYLCQWQGGGRLRCIGYVVHRGFESLGREVQVRCTDSNKASFYLVRQLCFMYVYSVINLTPFSLRSHHRMNLETNRFSIGTHVAYLCSCFTSKIVFHPSMNPVDGPYYIFYDGCFLARNVFKFIYYIGLG